MPRLTNPKHEHFAQLLAQGETADAAYVDVGYTENRGNAARLKANESVRARVAELLERASQRHDVTVDSLTRELEEAREVALNAEQGSAAVSATLAKAKLHGLLIERRESGKPGEFENLTDGQLDDRESDLDREIARLEGRADSGETGKAEATRH